MVIKLDDRYILTRVSRFWFYPEDKVPKEAEIVDEYPAGFEILRSPRNRYPYLRKVKSIKRSK